MKKLSLVLMALSLCSINSFAGEENIDSKLLEQRNNSRVINNALDMSKKEAEKAKFDGDVVEGQIRLYALNKIKKDINSGRKPDDTLLKIATGGLAALVNGDIPTLPVNASSTLPVSSPETNSTEIKSNNSYTDYTPPADGELRALMIIEAAPGKSVLFGYGASFLYASLKEKIGNSGFRLVRISQEQVTIRNASGNEETLPVGGSI